jgi:hypothetical protein
MNTPKGKLMKTSLKLKKGEVLVLRTCELDGTSYNDFKWPQSGPVSCSDWKPRAECGNGLHGLLWGVGDGGYLNWGEASWLVVRVLASDIVDIDRKVKFPRGVVEYFGERLGAVALIEKYAPEGSVVVGGTATAGDGGTATAGDGGTATAGDRGTATAGDGGTATAGDRGAIAILYWNGRKHRRAVFEVGEGEIEANVPYVVDKTGKPSKAEVSE